MVEHVNITDPDIHEPKGVVTATVGDVYVADGAGSGSWQTPLFEYGLIYTQDSDAFTISSIGTTPQTMGFTTDGVSNVVVADSANNRLTLTLGGIYWISLTVSIETVASGDAGIYDFKIADDGVNTPLEIHREMSGSADSGSGSVAGIISVGANSQLTVNLSSDNGGDTDDLTIHNAQLVAILLEAT